MSENNVFINGRIVPADKAVVNVSDAGLLHGASTFSTLLSHNGVVFRFERHLTRIMETVRRLGLRTDAAPGALTEGAYDLLKANGLEEARLRITLTPGATTSGRGGESLESARPTTLITADPLPEYPATWYEDGIGVAISTFRQQADNPIFGYKTGCYFLRVLARQEAAARGADEALWLTTDGRLAESCFCNAFLVIGGRVFTPPLDTPVLPGVVRGAVLDCCAELGVEAETERPLDLSHLLSAEEAFLSSSTMGVRPVVRIERHAVGEENPGEVTRRIMDAYREMLDRECAR